MKKILNLAILLLALPLCLVSCNNDDDLPNVEYNVTFTGGVMDESTNTIYIVAGETLSIDAITVTNNEAYKSALITGAEYYWDYAPVGRNLVAPFGFTLEITPDTPLGEHLLSIRTSVVAVDKAPAIGIVTYNVVVVADSADLPADLPDNTGNTTNTHPGLKAT